MVLDDTEHGLDRVVLGTVPRVHDGLHLELPEQELDIGRVVSWKPVKVDSKLLLLVLLSELLEVLGKDHFVDRFLENLNILKTVFL